MIKCYGCGALVEDIAGKPHKYIGASQGCWNLYTEVLAREYGEYNYPDYTHSLTVHTYAIQHPGQPGRQSTQSVNLHLASLYAMLVKKMSRIYATNLMGQILRSNPVFEWLEPPVPNGTITVIDVLKAPKLEEHEVIVKNWAEDVFGCWYTKHEKTIHRLLK